MRTTLSISLQWVVRGTPLGLEDNLMTNEQREKITTLRHQGFGYTAIANSVGLSKDSVKACSSPGASSKVAGASSALISASSSAMSLIVTLPVFFTVTKRNPCFH